MKTCLLFYGGKTPHMNFLANPVLLQAPQKTLEVF